MSATSGDGGLERACATSDLKTVCAPPYLGQASEADALSRDLPAGQLLLDLQQRRIRWRVLLVPRPGSTPLVLFEKRGKGGRLLHRRQARWSPWHGTAFIHPRDQVAGGLIPRCLVERIEALLRGAPLPRRRREWAQVHGRLVHW